MVGGGIHESSVEGGDESEELSGRGVVREGRIQGDGVVGGEVEVAGEGEGSEVGLDSRYLLAGAAEQKDVQRNWG